LVAPVSINNPPLIADQLSAGSKHTCALLSNASVKCWGFGGLGQLGYGDTATIGDAELPSSVGPVAVF
jgi:alpha-tubulin suppressor-like RCC1 family protein